MAAAVNRTDGRPGKRRRTAIMFRVSVVPTTGRKYCRRRLFGFYRYLNEASAHTTDRRRRCRRRSSRTLNVVGRGRAVNNNIIHKIIIIIIIIGGHRLPVRLPFTIYLHRFVFIIVIVILLGAIKITWNFFF